MTRKPSAGRDPAVAVISGAGIADDTFSSDIGTWNVTRAKRDCEAGLHGTPFAFDVAGVYEANRNVEVDDAKVVRFMRTPEVFATPLVAVIGPEGRAWLIDGHHRLRALWWMGAEVCAVWVIEREREPDYRVLLNGKPITHP